MLLKTPFCMDLLRERGHGEEGPATARVTGLGETAVFLPLFVLCELDTGARLSVHPRTELAKVDRLLGLCELVMPDRAFDSVCDIRLSGARR